jgi:hypothetical protein
MAPDLVDTVVLKYDCLGRILITVPFVENEATFGVENLSAAMYFIRIRDDSGLIIVDKKQIIGL